MPSISVVLTVYNRAAALPATIESLLCQRQGDFELLVMDDASSDGSGDVVGAFRDARIRYVRQPRNLGMPANLNTGIALATGEFVANLHDGDIYSPELLGRWQSALLAEPDAPFVFNAYDGPTPTGGRALFRPPFLDETRGGRYPGRFIARHYLATMTSCVWGTVMARRSAYAAPFDARYGAVADVEMWLRLGRGRDVAYVDEPLIRLAAREPAHPWNRRRWDFLRWDIAIYRRCLDYYAAELPSETRRARLRLPWLAGKKAARLAAAQVARRLGLRR